MIVWGSGGSSSARRLRRRGRRANAQILNTLMAAATRDVTPTAPPLARASMQA